MIEFWCLLSDWVFDCLWWLFFRVFDYLWWLCLRVMLIVFDDCFWLSFDYPWRLCLRVMLIVFDWLLLMIVFLLSFLLSLLIVFESFSLSLMIVFESYVDYWLLFMIITLTKNYWYLRLLRDQIWCIIITRLLFTSLSYI